MRTCRGLVLAFFQRREFFDTEAHRYAELVRGGYTVVVAPAGDATGTPEEVDVVRLAPDDPRADRDGAAAARGVGDVPVRR